MNTDTPIDENAHPSTAQGETVPTDPKTRALYPDGLSPEDIADPEERARFEWQLRRDRRYAWLVRFQVLFIVAIIILIVVFALNS